MGERDDRPSLPPPTQTYPHPGGGGSWTNFCRDPGTLTSRGENPLQSCHCTRRRQGGPCATRLERAPTRATSQDRHSPLSPRTPCSRGGNLGPYFLESPGHSPSGGETLEIWTNLPQLSERPPEPLARPAPPPPSGTPHGRGGEGWKKIHRASRIHTIWGGTPSKIGCLLPQSRQRPPGPPA